MNKPMVTKRTFLSVQVCVPKTFSDEEAKEFLEADTPCGTTGGWHMRTEDKFDSNYQVRTQCSIENRKDFIHIVFDA